LCEYIDGQPSDCMTCTDCELTGRTTLFDCVVFELFNGCCRVIVFSTHPGGVINPGLCDIVTVVCELHEECSEPTCTVQIPENILAADNYGYQLPAYGYQGEVCFLSADADGDGVPDDDDNCPITPNGPEGGTCVEGDVGNTCMSNDDCVYGGFCSMNQEDSDSDGIGDACECEVDADCNDGLWCTGTEACVNNACVPGISPCDDSNPCTTDPCDENNDMCLVKGCAAISPADPCCGDPVCEGTDFCVAKVTLKPGDKIELFEGA